MLLMSCKVIIPQSDVCAFRPHTLRLRKVCLEYRRAVSMKQMQQHVNMELKVDVKFFLRNTLLLVLKMVLLFPNLMVPPICPGLCSGISITCQVKQENQNLMHFSDLNTTRQFLIFQMNLPQDTLILGQIRLSWHLCAKHKKTSNQLC